jgi:mycofactocin system glycosyltransferase
MAGQPVGESAGARALARRLLDGGLAHPRPYPDTPHPGSEQVTVVVPVRDDAAGLGRTLDAIATTAQGVAAIVVVDDGSTRPVVAPTATVIRTEQPGGPAAARNQGWRQATTDLVVFVDADCLPEPGWLDALLPHFADPALGAVAPRITSRPGAGTPWWLATYEGQQSPLDRGRREGPVRAGSRVPYVPTAALAGRRQALIEAGGFDPALRYGEDVDFVWRLDGSGWRVRYEPAAVVTHPSRADLPGWLRQRYHYGQSAAPLAARHPGAAAPAGVSAWSGLAWGLVAAGFPLTGAAVGIGTTAAMYRRHRADPDLARVLAGLAATGNLRAGQALATALRRAWLPPAAMLSGLAIKAGRAAPAWWLAATLAAPALESKPADLDRARWWALRVSDDLAYQAGVWAGLVGPRSAAALFPRWS